MVEEHLKVVELQEHQHDTQTFTDFTPRWTGWDSPALLWSSSNLLINADKSMRSSTNAAVVLQKGRRAFAVKKDRQHSLCLDFPQQIKIKKSQHLVPILKRTALFLLCSADTGFRTQTTGFVGGLHCLLGCWCDWMKSVVQSVSEFKKEGVEICTEDLINNSIIISGWTDWN